MILRLFQIHFKILKIQNRIFKRDFEIPPSLNFE